LFTRIPVTIDLIARLYQSKPAVTMNESAKHHRRPLIALLASLILAACSGGGADPPLKGAAIGGPFTLTGHNGKRASDSNFRGKYPIYYFGFTNCPDVCPTDMANIGQALRSFEKSNPARAARVQPFFISVDPERDTPPVLARYVEAFHPRLIGLTGTADEIAAAAKQFAIYYAKEPAQGAGGYMMNHSRIAYLFGPKGEPIAILPADKGAPAVAAELDRWVE
jgi:protein SCO1/2